MDSLFPIVFTRMPVIKGSIEIARQDIRTTNSLPISEFKSFSESPSKKCAREFYKSFEEKGDLKRLLTLVDSLVSKLDSVLMFEIIESVCFYACFIVVSRSVV